MLNLQVATKFGAQMGNIASRKKKIFKRLVLSPLLLTCSENVLCSTSHLLIEHIRVFKVAEYSFLVYRC